jgi:outer membrane protein TolC
LEIPLFNTPQPAVKKARLIRDLAQKELEKTRNNLGEELHSRISDLRFKEKQILAFAESILREREETLRIASGLYREGEISLLEYLQLQQEAFRVEIEYYRVLTRWQIGKAELQEIVGVYP